jgi:hypothetical protein
MHGMLRRLVLPSLFGAALGGCSSDVNLGGGPTDEPNGAAGNAAVGGQSGAGTCEGLAFCEDFETPAPGGRGGDLDEGVWSFGRWAHAVQYFWFRLPANTYPESSQPTRFCGAPFSGILPPADVRVCEGRGADGAVSRQLNEVYDDQGGAALHSMRVRQPFDFSGRTGRIVWDVDAKLNPYHLGHGSWIEIWITDDAAPLPYEELFGILSLPRRGVGFKFRYGANCESTETSWGNALEAVVIVEDHEVTDVIDDIAFGSEARCFQTMDEKLNQLELRVSVDSVEFWASDFEDPQSFRARARVDGLNLPFSRGYVHFQHGQLAAAMDGPEGCEGGTEGCPSATQTFRWDNIGFDGPRLPTPSGYSVPDSGEPGPEGGIYTGWSLASGEVVELIVSGVELERASRATFDFNAFLGVGQELEYRFNQTEWHAFTAPESGEPAPSLRGFSVEVPVDELRAGDNQLEVRAVSPMSEVEGIGNVDLTVERDQ